MESNEWIDQWKRLESAELIQKLKQVRHSDLMDSRHNELIARLSKEIQLATQERLESIPALDRDDPLVEAIQLQLRQQRCRLQWHRIVFLGCSAGGDAALRTLFQNLEYPHLPIIIAMHHHQGFRFMSSFFTASGLQQRPITVTEATPLEAGRIYFLDGAFKYEFSSDGREVVPHQAEAGARFRPEIDQVLISAANCYGSSALGAILSGMLNDGVSGAAELSEKGGELWVQDPGTAEFKTMPEDTKQRVSSARIAPVTRIAERINQLSREQLELMPL